MTVFNVLDLFSGIGGFSIGLERTNIFKTVAFCEINPICQNLLKKYWPGVPCYDDIQLLTGKRLSADGIAVDVLTGWFPCQDISLAGRMSGITGKKSGLWHEMFRLIANLRPRLIIIENSPVLRSRGLVEMFWQFSSIGYDAEAHCLPLNSLDAPHRRDRLWIIAYPTGKRDGLPPLEISAGWNELEHRDWWDSEPAICRVVDAVSAEPHRLAMLGNAVSPIVPEIIGRALLAEGFF